MAAAQPKMSREEYRRAKDLEEARKAGTAPAEVDESGKDINPHIPQYISKAPWYFGAKGPTLSHQRTDETHVKEHVPLDVHYVRGTTGQVATRYRKGACENCGALTHKKSECIERPRKAGAKFTGKDIAPDEIIVKDLSLDFESKRDRWAGYDVNEYQKVIHEYEAIDEEKRRMKAEEMRQKELEEAKARQAAEAKGETPAGAAAAEKPDSESSDSEDDEDDEEKGYADKADQPGMHFDPKLRQTVRNLRIREDTAKYLRNLDINSAYYDPKTRSMRSNPYASLKDPKDVNFAGDNFVRFSGQVADVAQKQLFAWEATERGVDLNMMADPTKVELMHKEYSQKKEKFTEQQKQSILEKYGGAEHLAAPPKELLLAQTEHYVEYSKHGRLIKGQEKAKVSSKYLEDVHPKNHLSVWGSFWNNFRWGYACCHSLERNSYCTGEAGKQALQESSAEAMLRSRLEDKAGAAGEAAAAGSADEDTHKEPKSMVEEHRERMKKEKKEKKKKRKTDDDSDDEAKHKKELAEAMERISREEKEAEAMLKLDERDRNYNSLRRDHKEVTEADMEAYRLKRARADDPMANFS
eukprot:m.211894 g.211894  ORF g.211894 m.211894 type:complete len:582 (-) comp19096_c0_seq1:227-1972(-)